MHEVAPDPRRWFALALLCGAFFMVILDAAIVTVALPSIQSDLGFSAESLQWVVSAYALTFAGLLLLGGRAADLLGRRRVFMVGLVVFTGASLLCGLSWSPGALIGARALQGVGAAIMTPTALSIIMTTFAGRAGAQQGARDLGLARRRRRDRGVADRRPARRRPRLAVDLLHQHPGRRDRVRALPGAAPREQGRHGDAELRPRRALTITGALGLLVYAVVEAPTKGWGSAQTIAMLAGSAAAPRGLRLRRVAAGEPARAASLPSLADARRCEQRDALLRRRRLRDAVHPHALHPAGARLFGAAVRAHLDRVPDRRGRRLDLGAGDRAQGRLPPGRDARHGR